MHAVLARRLPCPAGYDEEARYFEAGVRRAKREELVARARGLVRSAFDAQLLHLRARLREHAARETAACGGRDGGFAAAASRCGLRRTQRVVMRRQQRFWHKGACGPGQPCATCFRAAVMVLHQMSACGACQL